MKCRAVIAGRARLFVAGAVMAAAGVREKWENPAGVVQGGPKSDLLTQNLRWKRSALLHLPYQAGTCSCGLGTAFNSSFSCLSGNTQKAPQNISWFRYNHVKLGSNASPARLGSVCSSQRQKQALVRGCWLMTFFHCSSRRGCPAMVFLLRVEGVSAESPILCRAAQP